MKLFPLLLGLLFFVIHYLFVRRVVVHLHLSAAWRRRAVRAVWGNYAAVLGYLAGRYGLDLPSPLYFLFSLAVGVGFLLLMGWLVYEALRGVHRLAAPFSPARREALKKAGDALFLGAGAGWLGGAVYGGAKRPVVVPVRVDQGRFGEGYRIVQISDMHVGGLIDRKFVAECVRRINALEADLVVITGDLTDMRVTKIAEALRPLAGLRSRFGTFYIPGNHEYFHGVAETLRFVEGLGITVLGNRALKIDNAFWLAGVYDLFGLRVGHHMPDLGKVLARIIDDAPVLLLAHQPRFVEYLEGFQPALMLCGHTHGGQVWPFGFLVHLVQPYLRGLHPLGTNRHIYVNSGIGFWGPPMRLGSRAEITLIKWR
ncbi:metallophosphoesterase [Hydrogenimonas sp.]